MSAWYKGTFLCVWGCGVARRVDIRRARAMHAVDSRRVGVRARVRTCSAVERRAVHNVLMMSGSHAWLHRHGTYRGPRACRGRSAPGLAPLPSLCGLTRLRARGWRRALAMAASSSSSRSANEPVGQPASAGSRPIRTPSLAFDVVLAARSYAYYGDIQQILLAESCPSCADSARAVAGRRMHVKRGRSSRWCHAASAHRLSSGIPDSRFHIPDCPRCAPATRE